MKNMEDAWEKEKPINEYVQLNSISVKKKLTRQFQTKNREASWVGKIPNKMIK